MANDTQGGCTSVAVLIVAIVLLIGNILFHTQESYLINYLGQSYKGNIVSVDSTHTGYGKYRFEYKIRLQNAESIKITEGNFKRKTHEPGQKVEVKVHKGKSEFKIQAPNIYITIFLAGLLIFFVKAYFVFRKTD
ncbi:hypothetical protein [Chryseobacterium sp. 22458]|uniref:hypothetical protein n=1 Tax=Chryseobacterium sp. 22458 TaxID=3453921 RepID=UPI003F87E630